MTFDDPYAAGFDWTDSAHWNQLVAAFNERRAVALASQTSPLLTEILEQPLRSVGDDAQYTHPSFYDGLGNPISQSIWDGLERLAIQFVDPSEPWIALPYPIFPYVVWRINYLTVPRWRELAVLPAGGFRRSRDLSWDGVNDLVFLAEYGEPNEGDLIGPWNYQDLQRGLAALTTTVRSLTGGTYKERLGSGDSLATQAANWAASSWTDRTPVPSPLYSFSAARLPSVPDYVGIRKSTTDATIYISEALACSCALWVQLRGASDIDGLGLTPYVSAQWSTGSKPAGAAGTVSLGSLGHIDTNPVSLVADDDDIDVDIQRVNGQVVCTWTFTHGL